ncbi:amino acid adenylation domain-containing protein [Streptomyces sp. NPDC051173]|uniref:non-ribosomal peptide synthetase n=1 Tax=Streptomyces sp. NPDC051173 TaxID=3155164 RepID=UPI00344C1E76
MMSHPDSRTGPTGPGPEFPRTPGEPTGPAAPPAPLTPAQQQTWLLGMLAPGRPATHVSAGLGLAGDTDRPALLKALRGAATVHLSPGARFTVSGGTPVRLSADPLELPVQYSDVSGLDEDERSRRTHEALAEAVRAPFDPENGPLSRALLLRTGSGEHRLLLVAHRLVADQSLLQRVLRDTAATYGAPTGKGAAPEAGGRPADQFPAPASAEPADRPAGLPPAPELPLDRPRPAQRSLDAGRVAFGIPGDTAAALRTLVARQGAELRHVLLAGYLVLLHRYSGQTTLAVAVPVAGAAGTASETTVAVRSEVLPDLGLAELVARVRADEASARTTPAPAAELLARPGFSYRAAPRIGELPGIRTWFPETPVTHVLGDLALDLVEGEDGVTGRLLFAEDVFDPATARRAVRHYLTLLDAAAEEPGRAVSALRLLTEEEERTIAELNGVRSEIPDLTFHQLFERQAARAPDAVAVRSQDGTLTYRELNTLANQQADLLRQLGVGPETTVGICMERGRRMVVALLGVLKAGGAYVPLDPRDPAERRDMILGDARAGVVVCTDPAAAEGYRTVVLDAERTVLNGRPAHDGVTPASAPEHAAYLLYTSGSTGKPKGVVVENRQLVAYTQAVIERLGIDEPLSWAMVQPLTVDSSVTALMPPLSTGGEVHLLSREHALDAARMADWMRTHAVDCLKIAPSHLRALQASARFADLLPRRLLVIGGEASDWQWMTALQRSLPHCRVFNHYGPTETTVGVLTLAVAEHLDARWDTAPIGVPLPNSQAHVVDAEGRPVPFGVVGELILGGTNLARGYHGRDELTSAAFVPDSLGGPEGARLYRTGDIVRRLADGSLAFLGRRDDQIKIRGFRVTLGEIEAALTSHEAVRGAVVVVREDTPGDRRVVAYAELSPPGAVSPQELERHVRERVSPHMVPQATVVLDALPLTPHGKVDRSALPVPAAAGGAGAAGLPPQGEVERQVAQAWREVLRTEAVGTDQNFFDVGGHSLLLVELQHRLQAVAGRDIELLDLFRHTSVRTQAAFLSAGGETPAPDTPPRARGAQQNALMKRRQQQLRAKRGRHE